MQHIEETIDQFNKIILNENMNKIIEKEKIHEGDIYSCVELNDGIVASGGSDNLIKLWKN